MMSYKKIDVLDVLWKDFASELQQLNVPSTFHVRDIEQLMTAKSVIDLSKHAIYVYMNYIHQLTNHFNLLRNEQPESGAVLKVCQLWTDLLRQRNQQQLKVRHHKSLDGECSFHSALELMEGKSTGFKEIVLLNSENKVEFKDATHRIAQLGRLAHGITFAELPAVGNIVMTSLLEHQDSLCLLARDKNNRIVGYSWGLMLRDFPVGEQGKANVFYIMDLVRDPDYYDPEIKVGAALREHWAQILNQNPDCHFLAYQHLLNHQFHMDLIDGRLPQKYETITFAGERYDGKSGIRQDDTSGVFIQYHFIRAHHNQLPFPGFSNLMSGIYKAFWHTAHSTLAFVSGALSFFGRHLYLHHGHDMVAKNAQKRISEPVTEEQQANDMQILKRIIADEEWSRQGTKTFFDQHVPRTVQILRERVVTDECSFEDLQQDVLKSGSSLMRRKVTANFYRAIIQNPDPTAVINKLITNVETPKIWVRLISEMRQQLANEQREEVRLI